MSSHRKLIKIVSEHRLPPQVCRETRLKEDSFRRTRRMIPRILTQSLIGTAVIGILLFAPAGTLRWPAGWVFLAGMIAFGLGTALWLAKTDPDLLAERMRPMMQAGQPRSDKVFMVVFGVMAM